MKLQPPPKQTALVHLGQTVADRLGSSGKACLGGAWFPSDYLTDVTLGTKTQIFIEQKRYAELFIDDRIMFLDTVTHMIPLCQLHS
ncbi:hypothetical protein ANN_24213 [Periplaneta americana]|uniref:Uncharacterized protein n=1 Tax=Periplaneta americana TaxID=6978 RepID=A0ABQ8S2G9_PERAM|nr:hypothetical protein ANN_24213 [Periplaneta americana]